MIVQRTELLILQCNRYVSTVQKGMLSLMTQKTAKWYGKSDYQVLCEDHLQMGRASIIQSIPTSIPLNSSFFFCGRYWTDYVRWYGLSPLDSIAIAADLGIVQSSIDPIIWAVGVIRDPLIQFTDSQGKIQELNAFLSIQYFFPPHHLRRTSHGMRLKDISNKKEYLLIGTDHRYPW